MPRDEEAFVDALRELELAEPTGTVYGMRTVPITNDPAPAGPEHMYDVPADGDCFFYCMMRVVKAWKDSGDRQTQAAYEQVSNRLNMFADSYRLEMPGFEYADRLLESETNAEERQEVQRLRLLAATHLSRHFPEFYKDSTDFAITTRRMYRELIAWPDRLPQREPSNDEERSSRNGIERKANARLHLLRQLAAMPDTSEYVRDGLTRSVQMGEKYLQCNLHTPNAEKFYRCIKACMQQLASYYDQNDGANRENETRDNAIVQTKTPKTWTLAEVMGLVVADLFGVYIDFYEATDDWSAGKHRDTTGPLPVTMQRSMIEGGLSDVQFVLPKLTLLRNANHFRYQLLADLVLSPTDVAEQERYRDSPPDAITRYYENGEMVGDDANDGDWVNPDACGPELDGLDVNDKGEDDPLPRPGGGGGGDGGGDGDGGGGGDDHEIDEPNNFVAGTMRFRKFYEEDHICQVGELTETQIAYGKARMRKAHESFMVHMASRHGYGQILLMSELRTGMAAETEQHKVASSNQRKDNQRNIDALGKIDPKQSEVDVAVKDWIKKQSNDQAKDVVTRGYKLAVRIIMHYDKLRDAKLGAWRAFLYLYGNESNLLSQKDKGQFNQYEDEVTKRWKRVVAQLYPDSPDRELDRRAKHLSEFMIKLVFVFKDVPEALSDTEAEESDAVKTVSVLLKSPQTDP